MKEQQKQFTGSSVCRHCGNKAPMEIGKQYSQVENIVDELSNMTWEEGYAYDILVCPACNGITLQRYYYHELMESSEAKIEILYPSAHEIPKGLPKKIEQEYLAALKVRNLSPNAYGVLLGRLLELVCDDRGAKKAKLPARLQELSAKGEIPAKLTEMANNLLELRHMGAHATVGELTPNEIPILDKLCSAILEYVYSAPYFVQDAEDRLKKLRQIERNRKKRLKS